MFGCWGEEKMPVGVWYKCGRIQNRTEKINEI